MFQPLVTMCVGTLSLINDAPGTEESQMDRNDGLMRGSREQRIAEMRSLGDADWNPGTLLHLHIGLLDHAEDVRSAALDAVLEISRVT